jgi:hypothetical protein
MAQKKKVKNPQVEDYRHEDAKRKNIPSAGLAARGRTFKVSEQTYFYNPQRSLMLSNSKPFLEIFAS